MTATDTDRFREFSIRDGLMRASNSYRTARRFPRPSITTLAIMSRRTDACWAACRR